MKKILFLVLAALLLSGCLGSGGNGIIKDKPILHAFEAGISSYEDVVRTFGQPAVTRISVNEMSIKYFYRMPENERVVIPEAAQGYKALVGCADCGELQFTFRPANQRGRFNLLGMSMSDTELNAQVLEGIRLLQAGEYEQAYPLVLQAAQGHSAEAQYNLGMMYASGDGVKLNYQQAQYWWQKAAAVDHPWALYELAVMLQNQEEDDLDPYKILGLYERSAKLGYEPAMRAMVSWYGLIGDTEREGYWSARLEALESAD